MDMMDLRRRLLQSAGIIPPAYQQTDYTQNTSYAFANLDYVPQQYDEFHVKFMFDTTDYSTGKCLLSAGTGTYQLILLSFNNSSANGFYYRYFSSGGAVTFACHVPSSTWMDIDIDSSGLVSCNGYTAQSTYNGALDGTATQLRLFRRANDSNRFIGKISEFYVKRNGEYKVNLIPCYRKSDNVAGFYDTVSNQFYYSASASGQFTAGPAA